jgi:hypothetical protein
MLDVESVQWQVDLMEEAILTTIPSAGTNEGT